jgi:hypothetical protein
MLIRAARDLPLADPVKAKLDDIDTQLHANDAPRTDFKDLQSDVLDGIRAGKLDAAKLATDFAAIDKGAQTRQAKEADALNALHAALDPTQLKALVDAVRAKDAAREAQHAVHDADAGTAADRVNRRVERLTAQLGLDPTQQKSVTDIVSKLDPMSPATMHAKHDEANKQMDAALTAFAGDTFDATKTPLVPAGKTPHEGAEKDTAFLTRLLPILTADQRTKLAAQREHTANRRGGPGEGWGGDEDRDESDRWGSGHNRQ